MATAPGDSIFAGVSQVVLRTPLGIWAVDPFATPDPTVTSIMNALGISVELRMGPLSPADLQAPSLPTNLGLLIGAVVLGGIMLYQRKR
jgi:hypothetical protein